MAQSIQWTGKVVADGKTEMSLTRSISVEAIETIKVILLGSGSTGGPDTDREIEIQPSSTPDQVSFVAIASDSYGDVATHIDYKVNSAANPAIRLDQPVTLIGAGAVSLLDSTLNSLFLTSTLVEDATIHIVVGRDATP
jgi:hypothetical protein